MYVNDFHYVTYLTSVSQVQFGKIDEEGIIEFLVKEKNFNESRVRSVRRHIISLKFYF